MIAYQRVGGIGLTSEEAAALAAYEATLGTALHLWQTSGAALAAIEEGALFRGQSPSFERYCADRWGLSGAQARRLIDRWRVYDQVRRELQITLRSSAQADVLLALPEGQRLDAVRSARVAGRISARSLREAAERTLAPSSLNGHTSRANGQTRLHTLPERFRSEIICADVRSVTREQLPAPPSLVIADPPYNISRDRNFARTGARTITSNFGEWDRLTTDEFATLLREAISWSYHHSAPDASIYWFCSDKVLSDVHSYMAEVGWHDSVTIYWHKTNPAPHFMRHTYVSSVEVCVFARKGSPTFNWLGQNTMHNCVSSPDPNPMENFIETPLVGGQERVRGPDGESLNLAQKSKEVIRRFIEVSSNPGELVLDLFAGTGTTSFVAQQLGRRWVAIEKRPEQCRIIEARLATLE
jgi:DNA modification methylase